MAAVIRSSGKTTIVLPHALANKDVTRQTAAALEIFNMRLIAALLLVSCLAACTTARKAMGVVSDIGSKPESVSNAESNAASLEASSTSRGIIRADDMGKVSKQVPSGLIGDSKNSLYSGDPIPPQ
jgi:predicted small secreted protein